MNRYNFNSSYKKPTIAFGINAGDRVKYNDGAVAADYNMAPWRGCVISISGQLAKVKWDNSLRTTDEYIPNLASV